jgi:beta-xylosidase
VDHPPETGADRPWLDATRSPDQRADALLAAMTLDEKVAQCRGVWLNEHDEDYGAFEEVARTRDVGPLDLAGRLPHGVGQLTRPYGAGPLPVGEAARAIDAIQRWLIEHTRLGVPALIHEECLTGLMAPGATVMPAPLNWGASFDPDVVRDVAAVIGDQMTTIGAHQGLAPVLDVIRDHRWGRTEECIGEDPYLIGVLGSAYVAGLQSGGRVHATLKHFVGHGSPEGGHNTAPVHAGPRELADVFALPFEMAVKLAAPGSVMSAYHDLDGVPVSADPELLTGLLRDRWGFDGVVVSDYWALNYLWHKHHVAAGEEDAAVAALAAGVDVELPRGQYAPTLADAVRAGRLDVAVLDRACRRVLLAKVRLGLFERPFAAIPPDTVLDTPAARAVARRAAARSITLLTNDGTLPLSAALRRVAVVGPDAGSAEALLGNYTFRNHIAYRFPERPDGVAVATVADALAAALAPDTEVVHVPGCAVTGDDRSGFAAAVAAARGADVVVAVVGDRAGHFNSGTVGEGTDSSHLRLPGVQAELIDAVADTGTPVVVVHVAGRPHDLSGVANRAAAIVEAWFPGEEGAAAVADVLVGVENPGGRLPVSFTRGAGFQPYWYGAGTLARQRYVDSSTAPVFCFGHGLSYTTFAWDDLVADTEVAPEGSATVSCRITNTGDRAGDEVVQLYVSDPVAAVVRPRLELRGFVRVGLAAGASARVRFELPVALCAFTGRDGRRVVEPGDLVVSLGASSRDLRLATVVRVRGEEVITVGEDRPLHCPVTVEREDGVRATPAVTPAA